MVISWTKLSPQTLPNGRFPLKRNHSYGIVGGWCSLHFCKPLTPFINANRFVKKLLNVTVNSQTKNWH